MRFAVVCNGTVYIGGFYTRSDAYDWAARNLCYEFQICQLIDKSELE